MRTPTTWLLPLTLFAVPAVAHAKPAKLLVVDDDKADCPWAGYTSIQAAVDAAGTSPALVAVCAGTYVENVVIGGGARLTVAGAGSGDTIVVPLPGTAGPAFRVTEADSVDIRELAVDGHSELAGNTVWGISYVETTGEVSDVVVRNVRNADGTAQGVGIGFFAQKTHVDDRAERVRVENTTRANVAARGNRVSFTLVDSTLIGPDAPKVWAPNGVQVGFGARGHVKDNTLVDFGSPVPQNGEGSGVVLICPGPTSVRDNDISGGDLGIALADTAHALVSGNHIEGSVSGVALETQGQIYGGSDCPVGSHAHDNTVMWNEVSGGAYGVTLAFFDDTAPSPRDNTLRWNHFEGDEYGAWVQVGAIDNAFSHNHLIGGILDVAGGPDAGSTNTWFLNACDDSAPVAICH